MAVAQTLKEIALEKAKKRPELVDYLTEEAPILTLLKWIPATPSDARESAVDTYKGMFKE